MVEAQPPLPYDPARYNPTPSQKLPVPARPTELQVGAVVDDLAREAHGAIDKALAGLNTLITTAKEGGNTRLVTHYQSHETQLKKLRKEVKPEYNIVLKNPKAQDWLARVHNKLAEVSDFVRQGDAEPIAQAREAIEHFATRFTAVRETRLVDMANKLKVFAYNRLKLLQVLKRELAPPARIEKIKKQIIGAERALASEDVGAKNLAAAARQLEAAQLEIESLWRARKGVGMSTVYDQFKHITKQFNGFMSGLRVQIPAAADYDASRDVLSKAQQEYDRLTTKLLDKPSLKAVNNFHEDVEELRADTSKKLAAAVLQANSSIKEKFFSKVESAVRTLERWISFITDHISISSPEGEKLRELEKRREELATISLACKAERSLFHYQAEKAGQSLRAGNLDDETLKMTQELQRIDSYLQPQLDAAMNSKGELAKLLNFPHSSIMDYD